MALEILVGLVQVKSVFKLPQDTYAGKRSVQEAQLAAKLPGKHRETPTEQREDTGALKVGVT